MIAPFRNVAPTIDPTAYVTASAVVIGNVSIGPQSSVWFHTVVRGDVFPIRIGARTNVQDNATLHVFGGRSPVTIEDDVTIGHGAIVHGASIGTRTLIGMGAIVLDGAEIGAECLVGAGALVTPGARVAAGQLVLGSPARVVRPLNRAERDALLDSASRYVAYAAEYRAAGLR